MKKVMQVALVLSLVLMCAYPVTVSGQNNRRSSSTTSSSQRSGNNSNTGSTTNNNRRGASTVSKPTGETKSTAPEIKARPETKPSSDKGKKPSSNNDRRPSSSAASSTKTSKVGSTGSGNRPTGSSGTVKPSGQNGKGDNSKPLGTKHPDNPGVKTPSGSKPSAVNKDRPLGNKSYGHTGKKPREYSHNIKPRPAYDAGSHYFGHRIERLPSGYKTMYVNDIRYFYKNGVYYRSHPLAGYIICRPPVGTSIAAKLIKTATLIRIAFDTARAINDWANDAAWLSAYHARQYTTYIPISSQVYLGNIRNQRNYEYFYRDGVFYIYQNGYYYVVDPPIGAVVDRLPEYFEEVYIEGRTYYRVENVLYRASAPYGKVQFEVVAVL